MMKDKKVQMVNQRFIRQKHKQRIAKYVFIKSSESKKHTK